MSTTLTAITHQLDSAPGGALSVTIPGDILSTNADTLHEEIFALLESAPVKAGQWNTLKLDLTGARMVDSVGLNLIVSIIRAVKSRPAKMEATLSSANIHRTFQFTCLDKQMTLMKV